MEKEAYTLLFRALFFVMICIQAHICRDIFL